MRVRSKNTFLLVLVGILAAAALIMLGRLSVGTTPAHREAVDQSDEYFDGLQAGEAQGRREGRALQEGVALPAKARRPVHDAFDAGYVAGANDVFAGYDGGWAIGPPYVVTIAESSGQIVYRIKLREPMKANVDYFLCPDGHDVCQEPRH
jgi:hypothetical protein